MTLRAQKVIARHWNTQSSSSNSRIGNDVLIVLTSFPKENENGGGVSEAREETNQVKVESILQFPSNKMVALCNKMSK